MDANEAMAGIVEDVPSKRARLAREARDEEKYHVFGSWG
jgi:hypothetical protein